MNERERRVRDERGLEESPRLSGETLLGHLGIACILVALLLFWTSFDLSNSWLTRLAPLAAFALGAAGVTLMMRVPAGVTPRSRDPRHPLTRAGAAPTLERPATWGERASLAIAITLAIGAGAGYLVAVMVAGPPASWSLLVACAAGLGLLTQALLIAGGRAPAPALNWQRLTIAGRPSARTGALATIGLVAIGSSLLLAAAEGYGWGALGLVSLMVMFVCALPLVRRASAFRAREASRRLDRPAGGKDAE